MTESEKNDLLIVVKRQQKEISEIIGILNTIVNNVRPDGDLAHFSSGEVGRMRESLRRLHELNNGR